MWQQVCDTIETGYSKYEVNLAGYFAQFKTDDKSVVFSALTHDWENACKAKLDHRYHSETDFESKGIQKWLREQMQNLILLRARQILPMRVKY